MTADRYHRINNSGKGITPYEATEGWHFCADWDYLLVGPEMIELEACTCGHLQTQERQRA